MLCRRVLLSVHGCTNSNAAGYVLARQKNGRNSVSLPSFPFVSINRCVAVGKTKGGYAMGTGLGPMGGVQGVQAGMTGVTTQVPQMGPQGGIMGQSMGAGIGAQGMGAQGMGAQGMIGGAMGHGGMQTGMMTGLGVSTMGMGDCESLA